MRPEGLVGMAPKSIKKKIKDKKFAAGVDRSHMKYCEELLGISFDDFVSDVIQAMQVANSL